MNSGVDGSAVVTGQVTGRIREAGSVVGLADVAVSDGATVTRTDADGCYRLLVDPLRRHTGLVQLTVPSGWRAPVGPDRMPAFFRRVRLRPGREVTADFTLHADPAQRDRYRFVALSDVHVQVGAANTRKGLADQLVQINEHVAHVARGSGPPARFVVVCGDLTNDASAEEYADYVAALTASELPVWTAPGNHDLVGRIPGGAAHESTFPGPYRDVIDRYRQAIGPEWYSFQYGEQHFVVLENYRGLPEPDQLAWLEQDLALNASGKSVIVVAHVPWNVPQTPVDDVTSPYLELLRRYDVRLLLAGHTHTNDVTTGLLGDAAQVVTTSLAVSQDRTPRGYRLVELGTDEVTAPFAEIGAERAITVVQASATHATTDPGTVWVDHYHPPGVTTEAEFRIDDAPWLPLRPVGRRAWLGEAAAGGARVAGSVRVRVRDHPDDAWSEHTAPTRARAERVGSPVQGAAWPMFHADARRSGVSLDVVAPPLDLAWLTHAGGSIATSSPAVASDTVVIGVRDEDAGGDNGVLALDLATGERRWRVGTGSAVDASVAVSDDHGIVIAPEVRGPLHAVDLRGGRVRWTWRPEGPAPCWMCFSPAIIGDIVYQAYSVKSGTHVVALDVATGRERWHTAAPTGRNWFSYAGPTVRRGLLVFATAYANLVALDSRTGATRWETRLDAGVGVGAKPVIVDDLVLLACQGDRLVAVDAATGRPRWSHRASGPPLVPGAGTSATPAVADGHVYAAFTDGSITDLGLATGEPVWRFQADGPVLSSPAVSGRTLYIGANDGLLRAIDHASGQCRWQHDFGAAITSSPAVTGSTVVAAAWSGLIGAFTGAPAVSAPSPPG